MIEFRIFRFLIEKTLFSPDNISRQDILRILINSKPKDRFLSNKIDAEWIVTNVDTINNDSLKFFLGRKHEIELSQLNKDGDIIDKPENDIPHSIIYLHLPTGIGAIQLNSEVASTSLAISKRLQILLGMSGVVKDLKITIRIAPVRVSTNFTQRISEAFRLMVLQATYTKPNPPDGYRMVQQPVQEYLGEMDGETVKVKFIGDALEKEPAVNLSAAAIRTGNFVTAKIQETAESAPETISSAEEEIAKFYIEENILLREDSDPDIIASMLKAIDELAPTGGINANNREKTEQFRADI